MGAFWEPSLLALENNIKLTVEKKSMKTLLMTALVSLIAIAGCSQSKVADSDEEKLRVARSMVEAWNTLDWEQVYDLFTEDGVLHSVMHEPVVGRPAIRERLDYLEKGVDRIELQIRHMGVIDGVVFMERVDDFEFNGRHGEVPVVGVLEIKDGKVAEWREYYDRATLERAVAPE